MSKRAIVAIIALVLIISVVSISVLTNSKSLTTSDSNSATPTVNPTNQPTIKPTNQPTSQPTNNEVIQSYTGYLVSFNYVTSQTNGVESTQLVFTNKTFNYAGYISVENDCVYNVTYSNNNPNQALSITNVDLTIGLMGSAEQVSITNVAITDSSTIHVLLQNAGETQSTINSAFINGVATTVTTPVGVAKNGQTVITFTSGGNATFTLTPGTSYTIKLITAKGTLVVSAATTYSP